MPLGAISSFHISSSAVDLQRETLEKKSDFAL